MPIMMLIIIIVIIIIILRLTQTENTEQLQNYIPGNIVCFR